MKVRTHACPGILPLAAIAVAVVALAPAASSAKTPDGMPPSQETVCSGLHGAAYGLCVAYCEAQDCDVHPRPSCAQLLRNFRRITDMPAFPCDRRCGNGIREPGEDCDPPGSVCPDGIRPCSNVCTCPEPFCGDGIVDPGEQCDPKSPLSICPCQPNCTCETTEPACCECPLDDACVAEPATGCPTDCFKLPGLVCSPVTLQCEEPVCCACPTGAPCFEADTEAQCIAAGCDPVSGANCSDDGCVGFSPGPP